MSRGGGSKDVATQASTSPLIQEVEEEGTEEHAETSHPAPRKVLSRPGEPSGATHKEHDLHMCMGSVRDSEGLSDNILFFIWKSFPVFRTLVALNKI